MATKIEWTDETANWIVGCTKTRAKGATESGCKNCYAATAANSARLQQFNQYKTVVDGSGNWNGNVEFVPKVLEGLLKGKRSRRVFAPSMSDPFHPNVKDDWLDEFFATVALTPHIQYQVLTKRPERMFQYFTEVWQGTLEQEFEGIHIPAGDPEDRRDQVHFACEEIIDRFGLADVDKDSLWTEDGSLKIMQWDWPLPNLHLGVSVENQAAADERIPWLLKTPAAVRFLSVEPQLEEIDLTEYLGNGVRQAQRGNNLPVGIEGEATDRRSGANLEAIKKEWTNNEGRSKNVSLFTDKDLDKRKSISDRSAQVGVSAFLRTDSARNDDQSQGWGQEKQSSIQLRNCDIIGTDDSRFQDRAKDSVWTEESCQQIDRLGHGKNKGDVCNRQFNTEANCRDLWSGASNSLKNSKGGSSGNVGGGDSRLYIQKESREEEARYDGQILLCITGGESGPNARPFNLGWARSLRDQCQASGTKFFLKQLGSNVWDGDRKLKLRDRKGGAMEEWPEDLRIREVL